MSTAAAEIAAACRCMGRAVSAAGKRVQRHAVGMQAGACRVPAGEGAAQTRGPKNAPGPAQITTEKINQI